MTYHTIRLKIKTGSVDEKREAINQLFHRNSQTASRLLIEAAKDASSQVVFLAALGMRIGPREVQDRYKQSYIELASHSDYRIRSIAIGKLDVFDDPDLADMFRKAASSSHLTESITACKSLVSLGITDEVRAKFSLQSPHFIFQVIKAILDKGKAVPQDMVSLDSVKDALLRDQEAATTDDRPLEVPRTTEKEFDDFHSKLMTQIDEKARVDMFDMAIAELSTRSPNLARHFRRLAGTEHQCIRAFRHLGKSGSHIIEALLAGARHPDAKIRSSSMSLLADLKELRTFEIAFSMLGDSDEYAQMAAIDALGKLGDARALDRLIEIATSSDESDEAFSQSYSALEAIAALQVDQKKALITVYRNGNKQVGPLAVEMLTKLKDRSLISIFEEILREGNPRSAVYALKGIAEIGTKHCREVVKQYLHDERPKVRALAEHWCKEWGLT